MTDSLIGYATGTLTDPPPPLESQIGFAFATLHNPHRPIGVFDGTSVRYVRVQTFDGVTLR